MLRNLPADAGDLRDTGSVFGLGRSPGGGNGTPLQYFCGNNPMDRDWWATAHGVPKIAIIAQLVSFLTNWIISFQRAGTMVSFCIIQGFPGGSDCKESAP